MIASHIRRIEPSDHGQWQLSSTGRYQIPDAHAPAAVMFGKTFPSPPTAGSSGTAEGPKPLKARAGSIEGVLRRRKFGGALLSTSRILGSTRCS